MRSLVVGLAALVMSGAGGAFELKGLTLGGKTSVEQVESAMGVKCGVGANDMQVCNGSTTIGGVWGTANIVVNPAGRLQRIHFFFDADSYDGLAEAFAEKYGKHVTRRPVMQNGFGAKFQATEKTWIQKSGNRIDLSENTFERGKASAYFSTPADRALMNETAKADRKDM